MQLVVCGKGDDGRVLTESPHIKAGLCVTRYHRCPGESPRPSGAEQGTPMRGGPQEPVGGPEGAVLPGTAAWTSRGRERWSPPLQCQLLPLELDGLSPRHPAKGAAVV